MPMGLSLYELITQCINPFHPPLCMSTAYKTRVQMQVPEGVSTAPGAQVLLPEPIDRQHNWRPGEYGDAFNLPVTKWGPTALKRREMNGLHRAPSASLASACSAGSTTPSATPSQGPDLRPRRRAGRLRSLCQRPLRPASGGRPVPPPAGCRACGVCTGAGAGAGAGARR